MEELKLLLELGPEAGDVAITGVKWYFLSKIVPYVFGFLLITPLIVLLFYVAKRLLVIHINDAEIKTAIREWYFIEYGAGDYYSITEKRRLFNKISKLLRRIRVSDLEVRAHVRKLRHKMQLLIELADYDSDADPSDLVEEFSNEIYSIEPLINSLVRLVLPR